MSLSTYQTMPEVVAISMTTKHVSRKLIWRHFCSNIYLRSDRIRTMVNVEGDAIGAAIVYRYTKDKLDEMDKEDQRLEKLQSADSQHQVDYDVVSANGGLVNTAYQPEVGGFHVGAASTRFWAIFLISLSFC